MAVMIGEKEVARLGEPVDLRGINDDPRTKKAGIITLTAKAGKPLKGPRIRQLFEMGVEWKESVAREFKVSEEEILRRLLAHDPTLMNEEGALVGVAQRIQESIVRVRPGGAKSRPQAFPLLGEQPTLRGWVADYRLILLFLAQPFYGAGNPEFGPGYVPPEKEEGD